MCDSPSRSRLDASLLWQNQTLPLLALIDSGADESFLDSNVVAQLAINTVPLDLPIMANTSPVSPKELCLSPSDSL